MKSTAPRPKPRAQCWKPCRNAQSRYGQTRELPQPFFVIASQNPIEMEGTYPLPEAQLDRFLFRVMFDAVNADVLQRIITERRQAIFLRQLAASADDLNYLFTVMERIYLPKPVAGYIARLVAATVGSCRGARECKTVRPIRYLASGGHCHGRSRRANALLDGRPTVGFEDVAAVAKPVMNHRLILNYQARFDRVDASRVLTDLLEELDETGLDLPTDVSLQKA